MKSYSVTAWKTWQTFKSEPQVPTNEHVLSHLVELEVQSYIYQVFHTGFTEIFCQWKVSVKLH